MADPKLTYQRKIFWISVILLNLALFLWQMGLNVEKYFNAPISSIVTMETITTHNFPSFSVCLNYFHFFNLVEETPQIDKSIGYKELTIDDLLKIWKMYSNIKVNATIQCSLTVDDKKCENSEFQFEKTDFLSLQGLCQNFDPKLTFTNNEFARFPKMRAKLEPNQYVKPLMESRKFPYFKVYIHEPGFIYDVLVILDSRTTIYKYVTEFYVTIKEVSFINTKTAPCLPLKENFKCWKDCLNAKFEDLNICRVPFFNSTKPYCTKCNETQKALVDFYMNMMDKEDLFNCKCPRPCFLLKHQLTRMTASKSSETWIEFYLDHNLKEIIKEFYTYPLSMFVTDLANFAGFFLGASVLSFVELFELFGIEFRKLISFRYSNLRY